MQFIVQPGPVRAGTVRVPGDKSISHRALMLGSIADGTTTIRGFLDGEDCLATMAALRAMGVAITVGEGGEVSIAGAGQAGLVAPAAALDLGNSGTAMRLFAGLLAGQPFDATLTGDASLRSRPMRRVIEPLARMGADIASDDGRPPLRIAGGRSLRGIDYALPVASAQVKSAVLLAGLYANGETRVHEPAPTRDHSERMLTAMGVVLERSPGAVSLRGGQVLRGTTIDVPADLSSATFPMLAALLSADAELTLSGVGINPTRTGVIDILRQMGADIDLRNTRKQGDEPVADVVVRASALRGIRLDPALVPLAIDEFPALFVAAAAATGRSEFGGLAELRVKESDRIAMMAKGLAALGIRVEEKPDGAVVHGGRFSGGRVDSGGDHRIAMAFAVAATIATAPVQIDDVAPVDTSFPGFAGCLAGLGADIRTRAA